MLRFFPNSRLSARLRLGYLAFLLLLLCLCFRGSVLGHVPHPEGGAHFYGATKYAVTALTEGTRLELLQEKTHIRVTSISPGLVRTEFAYSTFKNNKEAADKMYSQIKVLEVEDITRAVVFALTAPPHAQIGEIIIRPTEQVF